MEISLKIIGEDLYKISNVISFSYPWRPNFNFFFRNVTC